MELDIRCWDERNWEALLWGIYRQRCILLLGPDAALEATGPGEPHGEAGEEFRPSSVILANQLANELARDNHEDLKQWNLDPNDLPQVAQYYVLVHNRLQLEPKIMAFFDVRKKLTSRLHRNLARLPFYLVISSTCDNMMANALRELPDPLAKEPRLDYYNFQRPRPHLGEMGTAKSPLIYHLFGCPENPDSLVITESDLLDLLVKVASGNVPLPEKILTELISEDNCLLFWALVSGTGIYVSCCRCSKSARKRTPPSLWKKSARRASRKPAKPPCSSNTRALKFRYATPV